MADFTIIPLAERPELVDSCAAWSYGEWGSQIPTRSLMKVYEDYKASIRGDSLPMTWVAVNETGRPIGMVRLKKNDPIEREDLSPWLSSLYVHHRYRGKGLARQICAYIEGVAKNTYGFDTLYLSTGSGQKLCEKLGFEKIDTVPDRTGFHKAGRAVMMKKLTG